MRFSQYINQMARKYVALYLDNKSQKAMRKWCVEQGFDLTTNYDGQPQSIEDWDFHLTIFFTTSEHDTRPGEMSITPLELTADHFELLGVNHDVPVLKINTDNDHLQEIRRLYVEMGYKDEWPEYKPHVSLSYKYSGKPDITNLSLPPFKLYADKLVIKNQKERAA